MSSANIGISSTNMGQFSSLMVSSVAGGMITSSIYGGEFSDAFAMGFVQSAVDLSFNDWNGHFDMTPQEVTETVLDVIPIVSNVKSLYEFSAGHSIFGEPLTDTQRALAGATIFLGAAGGIMKSGTKFAVKRAPTLKSGSGLGGSKKEVDKFGNTISRQPKSLQDKMTLDEAKRGEGIVKMENLDDPKYKGMQKMEHQTISTGGKKSSVHYVRDADGNMMDFKFKKHSTDYIHNYEKVREAGIR